MKPEDVKKEQELTEDELEGASGGLDERKPLDGNDIAPQ